MSARDLKPIEVLSEVLVGRRTAVLEEASALLRRVVGRDLGGTQ